MKHYLLLSNNHQSGPFSLEEIRNKSLKPLDLIWIENESTAWQYAGEIEELKEHVKATEKPKFVRPKPDPTPVYVSMPEKSRQQSNQEGLKPFHEKNARKDFLATDVPHIHPPEALKERYPVKNNRPIWSKQILQGNELVKLAAVFAGVILGAIVMKKAADDLVAAPAPVETNIAQVITEPEIPETKDYQTALVKEVVSPVGQKAVIRSLKPKDIRAQVKVKANDYKTGVFGGISNLELTTINSSPHFIDRLTISVDFFKKNGDRIETKNYTIHSLAPNSSKKLDVPQSSRGTKVKISVQQVYSKEYTAALKQA
ncbi:MAG: hypothetical protein ACXWV0_03805 [Flavisolibacter sp.]